MVEKGGCGMSKKLLCKSIDKKFIIIAFTVSLISPFCYASVQTLLATDYINKLLSGYTKEQVALIQEDKNNIQKLVFRGITPPKEKPTYIATAGGPGSNKSTLLEKYWANKKNYVYLDPDQRVLKLMINTYSQEFTHDKISEAGIKTRKGWEDYLYKAYTKWRNASNYIVSQLLNEAYAKNDNILHGTTSTSPQVENLYKNLKIKDYKIVLLLCYSSDENRMNALKHRTEVIGSYRLVPEEIVSKGKIFPERFPIYFKYADEIQLYWIDNFLNGEILAATLNKNSKSIIIHNEKAMEKFRSKYNEDRIGKSLEPLEVLIKNFTDKWEANVVS